MTLQVFVEKYFPVSKIDELCSAFGVARLKFFISTSVTSKKSPNVCKSCPKMISLAKLKILTTLQKMPKNVGKMIVATGFEKLPKVQ